MPFAHFERYEKSEDLKGTNDNFDDLMTLDNLLGGDEDCRTKCSHLKNKNNKKMCLEMCEMIGE